MQKRTLFVILIAFICLILFLTGCTRVFRGLNIHDIDDYMFVRTLGIDQGENGETLMTISFRTIKGEGASGSQEETVELKAEHGETLSEAQANFYSHAHKEVFFAHTNYILIGEDAAREDILKYIDVFIREHETRNNIKIFLIKDAMAQDALLKTAADVHSISDILDNLLKMSPRLSWAKEVQLIELINSLDDQNIGSVIPYLSLQKKTAGPETAEKSGESRGKGAEEMDLILEGYGVIKDTQLIGFIQEDMARGLNWIRDEVISGQIQVKDNEDNNVIMEIIDTKTDVIPRIKENELSVLIKIFFSTNVIEQSGTEDIYQEDTLDYLVKQQSNIIKSEVEKMIEYTQKNKVDILNLADVLFHKEPVRWEQEYKDKWQELFPELKIDVRVQSKINRVYSIKEPIKGEKE